MQTPIKAIRAKCLDCCCGSAQEVRLCTIASCPLYPYRFGKNPYRTKRQLSEEQRNALISRLSKTVPNNTGDFSNNALSESNYTHKG